MKNYELNCLISSDLTEEEVKKTTEKIDSIIQKEKGSIIQTNKPISKTTAYPIKEQKEALLVNVVFSLDPKSAEKVKKEIEKIEEVLRVSLTIKKEIKKHHQRRVAPKKVAKERKDKLKEIDEKLNKILE